MQHGSVVAAGFLSISHLFLQEERRVLIRDKQLKIFPVPEFIDPRFRENKPKTLVFT
jgi:hypothetical protein